MSTELVHCRPEEWNIRYYKCVCTVHCDAGTVQCTQCTGKGTDKIGCMADPGKQSQYTVDVSDVSTSELISRWKSTQVHWYSVPGAKIKYS